MTSQTRQFARPIAFSDTWASAAQSETMSIPDLARGLEAIVVAVIGREGNLEDANRGFLLLMSGSGSPLESDDVRPLFVNPRFEEIIARRADPFDGAIYRGPVSFGSRGGKTTSLPSAIYAHDGGYVLVAEHNIASIETLRATVLELQDDLAMARREIMHLECRIAQLQELADAALRDRDTLLDALAQRAGSGE